VKKLQNQRWQPRNYHKDVKIQKFLAIKTYKLQNASDHFLAATFQLFSPRLLRAASALQLGCFNMHGL